MQKQTLPSLDFRTVPSERGWALLKVRSAKQLVAHLLLSDDEIGPIEEELLNRPAPDSVATKQDLSGHSGRSGWKWKRAHNRMLGAIGRPKDNPGA